jgi:hypothetical protein
MAVKLAKNRLAFQENASLSNDKKCPLILYKFLYKLIAIVLNPY